MQEGQHPIQLIVGLGNPGPAYQDTRHNVGSWFINALCQQFRLTLKQDNKFHANITTWKFAGLDWPLLIPNTFMNHSGRAVGAYTKYYQIPANAVLIVHDELDFEPGIFRYKIGGGHAGHNGLKDIIHHLSSREFQRIRIGIGHPGNPEQVTDYVLSKPTREDKQKINQAIQTAIQYLQQNLTVLGTKNGI